jgi:hypothetical protein
MSWNEAWHGRAAGGSGAPLSTEDAVPTPYGLPEGMIKFNLVDPDTATADVQQLLATARDIFGHHGPASDYRVLANWPSYLGIAIDSTLREVALTPEWSSASARLRAIAREHVAGLPDVGGVSRQQMSAFLTPAESAGITALLFMYMHFISDVTIAMVRLSQGFDGAERATRNMYAVR